MEFFDVSRAFALAEPLLDKAQRYRETADKPELCEIAFVDGVHDAFAQIKEMVSICPEAWHVRDGKSPLFAKNRVTS